MLKTEKMQEETIDKKPWLTPEVCDQQIKSLTQGPKGGGLVSETPNGGPNS